MINSVGRQKMLCIGAVNIIIIWLSRHWQGEAGGGWGGPLVNMLPTAIITTQKGGVTD